MILNNTITKLREYIIGNIPLHIVAKQQCHAPLKLKQVARSCPIGNSLALGTKGSLIGSNNLMHYQFHSKESSQVTEILGQVDNFLIIWS